MLGRNPLGTLCYLLAAILWALHFVHLNADFPSHTAWMDWAKYTDEGWYGDAAIRQILFGHWRWEGDFNPAVALPVWPLLEWFWFHLTGVSLAAARVLTLLVFGATIVAGCLLLVRGSRFEAHPQGALAAPFAALLLAASPFLWAFERMAILEPLLVALTLVALLAAGALPLPDAAARGWRRWAVPVALGVLLPLLVLTKTTAVFLLPAVLYRIWARAGYRLRPALRLAVLPCALGALLWAAYFLMLIRPHLLIDYRYLFSANAYIGAGLQPLYIVVLNTIGDGAWIGLTEYVLLYVILVLAIFWRPGLWRNPEFASLWLWAAGYVAFLAYHNNLQPRYYLVLAVPTLLIVAAGLDYFRRDPGSSALLRRLARARAVEAVVLLLAVRGIWVEGRYIRQPSYAFWNAAHGVAGAIRARHAADGHPMLLQSISGSDITLMTGIPSINDDFGVAELPARVAAYRPGWFAAWNDVEDDKAEAITPLYRMTRVAAWPAYDDPARNLLILYRLDPRRAGEPKSAAGLHGHKAVPRQLKSRLGEQPTTDQLRH